MQTPNLAQAPNEAAPQPEPLAAQLRARPEPRQLNRLERGAIIGFLVLLFAFVLVYIVGGTGATSYILARTWSDASAWMRDHFAYFLVAAAGYVARIVVAGPTVTIPLAGDSKGRQLVRIRRRAGSLQYHGTVAKWREGPYEARINRDLLASHGMLGGHFVTARVHRHVDEAAKTVVYETAQVELTRNQYLEEKLKILAEQNANLAHQVVRGVSR